MSMHKRFGHQRLGMMAMMIAVVMIGALPGSGTALHAQGPDLEPYEATEGTATALAAAQLKFGSGARLVMIAALGNRDYDNGGMIVPLRFFPGSGAATVWVYQFLSPPTGEHLLLAVVDIPGMGRQAFEAASPVPLPDNRLPLDLSPAHTTSTALVARLAADTVYQRYRTELPGALPETIALTAMSAEDSATVPAWFPRNAPLWKMRFTGGGDSAMVCFMSTATGVTWCVRGTMAAAVPGSRNGALRPAKMDLTATGRGRNRTARPRVARTR